MRRPGPTDGPGLVYSLTLHPEPQGPAASTPARRGPAPAPRPRPAPHPGACALRRPRPAGQAPWASFFAGLWFGASTPNSGVRVGATRARRFPRRRCQGTGRALEKLPGAIIILLKTQPALHHPHTLVTCHFSLQHMTPTCNPLIQIFDRYLIYRYPQTPI